jgi:thiol-disulfide isomerase/thioredoxin
MILELGANATDADFEKLDQLLEQDSIVWNHATWCGHCVNMEDEWNNLKSDQKIKREFNVISVESKALEHPKIQNNPILLQKLTKKEGAERVSYFPLIFVFVLHGKHVFKKTHEGDRTSSAMKETLEEFKKLKTKSSKSKKSQKAKKEKPQKAQKGGESIKMTLDNFVNNMFNV